MDDLKRAFVEIHRAYKLNPTPVRVIKEGETVFRWDDSILAQLLKLFRIALGAFLLPWCLHANQGELNIYIWHSYLPDALVKKFEAETGIRVRVDVYDSNEVLEAKMLAGSTGYDLVFPSAWPYLARQIPAGLYQPLKKELIPNLAEVDPDYLKMMAKADPQNTYAVPYLWGAVGFVYNKQRLAELEKRRAPGVAPLPTDSWAMFFDPDVVQVLAGCGISMLDEPSEVILPAMMYLGIDPQTTSKADLDKVTDHLRLIRPAISRFDSARSNDEAVTGNMCLVQHWLGSVAHSQVRLGKAATADLEFVIPKEGSLMWIDVMAIPADAPNADNAHKFINFLLRPENMAVLTNATFFANPVPKSLPFVEENIRKNPAIYPPKHLRKRLVLNEVASPRFLKLMVRAMTKVRTGR